MSASKSTPIELKISEMLSNIMNERGISKNKHTTHIANVLGITITHANRKMKGFASWENSQLEKVAKSLGVSLSDLFKMVEDSYEEKHAGKYIFNKEEMEER
jgi:transcriptional regulator with XRE-family HTH domain